MPIFAPFSYLANPIVPPAPAWDPSDFTNVQYWWRADLGITTSGTGVSQWRDQINNFDMIQRRFILVFTIYFTPIIVWYCIIVSSP